MFTSFYSTKQFDNSKNFLYKSEPTMNDGFNDIIKDLNGSFSWYRIWVGNESGDNGQFLETRNLNTYDLGWVELSKLSDLVILNEYYQYDYFWIQPYNENNGKFEWEKGYINFSLFVLPYYSESWFGTNYEGVEDFCRNSGFSSPREYEEDVFDCSEMSTMVQWALKSSGFSAKIVRGKHKGGFGTWGAHAWVQVYDPVRGKEIIFESTRVPTDEEGDYWWFDNMIFDIDDEKFEPFGGENFLESVYDIEGSFTRSEFDWWNHQSRWRVRPFLTASETLEYTTPN